MTKTGLQTSCGRTPPVESQLSPRDFERLASLVLEYTGIAVPETKRMLLQSKLAKRLRAQQISEFGAYCRFVSGNSEAARDERQELISAITTNVTRFFREPHHFRDLATRVLPPLITKAERGEPVRIWSAACSSGEEAYSLAFTLLDLMPDAHHLDIKILATDLDRTVLRTAVLGQYPASVATEIERHSSLEHVNRGPAICRNWIQVGNVARSLVSFKQLNLAEVWPFRRGFDVIICRNVLIYFEQSAELTVFSQFSRVLKPGGYLYLGHSERLDTVQFSEFKTDGITTYRRL